MTQSALFFLELYKQAKRWKALPDPGGLLDQEVSTMRKLDLIADLVDEHEREQARVEKERAEIARLRAQGGHF